MKLPPGIETRVDTAGITRYRAHAKHGGHKTRGPWTPDLNEALGHRIELAGDLRGTREACSGMTYWGAPRPGVLGLVYFIQAGPGGPVKIGHTRGVLEARFKQLQAHNHEELRLLSTREGNQGAEKELHRTFAHHRIRGEWFRPVPEVLSEAHGTPTGPREDQMGHEEAKR